MAKFIILFIVAVFVSGCVRTDMTGFVDPAYRHGPALSSVVIIAQGMPLAERVAVEDTVVQAFQLHGVCALRALEIAPPTRALSREQEWEQQWAGAVVSGVQTVLVLTIGEKSEKQVYIPPTYTPGQTYGTVNTFGNTSYLNLYQTPGYTIGGYTVSKPQVSFAAALYDLKTGNTIWTADSLSRGGAVVTYKQLAESVARKTVSTLMADDLFKKTPPPTPQVTKASARPMRC